MAQRGLGSTGCRGRGDHGQIATLKSVYSRNESLRRRFPLDFGLLDNWMYYRLFTARKMKSFHGLERGKRSSCLVSWPASSATLCHLCPWSLRAISDGYTICSTSSSSSLSLSAWHHSRGKLRHVSVLPEILHEAPWTSQDE